jgi:thymidylate kinase
MAIQIQRPSAEPTYPADTVPALGSFLDELGRAGIRYCHWKSNEHLAAGLAGRTDLDLLIDAADAERLRDLARRHGLKALVPPPSKDFPGMEHLLGFDPPSGRLFHLHVHRQLVLGEEHVKDHRLPLERPFLEGARPYLGVPVPSPELELAVLVVRALLKYRDRDVVKDVLGIRSPGLKDGVRAEVDWLLERTTVERVRATLHASGDVVPGDVVVRFLETYARDLRAGATFLLLRSRLRSSLRRLRRHGRLRASRRRLAATWRRRIGRPARMRPASGGRTVALVGADGSGKSTAAAELAAWLGWKLDVRVHYLGSKSPSRRSRWSYVGFRALRRGHRVVSERLGSDSVLARGVRGARDVALGLHHLAVGRDRARRLDRGRRQATEGGVVIFDRFPLVALSEREEHLILDGPRIRRTLGARGGRLLGVMADREERMYRRFGMPDHLVVLQVSPEVSIRRKPDHRPEVLAAKSRAAVELAELAERAGVDTIRVDADRPLDEVLLELERRLWGVL